jgi:tetratricopeptide (TPR) repeat protein
LRSSWRHRVRTPASAPSLASDYAAMAPTAPLSTESSSSSSSSNNNSSSKRGSSIAKHARRSFQELLQAAHQTTIGTGDLVKARELVEAALDKPEASTTSAAHLMHGSICLQLGAHQAAVPSLMAVLKKDPSNWQAATNLASAYLRLDDDATAPSKAVRFARRAVELNPNLEAAQLILVNALRAAAVDAGPKGSEPRLRLLQEAVGAGRNLLELHARRLPQPAGASSEPPHCAVGEVLVDLGELEEAWALAMQAATAAGQGGPLMASACILAGRVQSAAGQPEKALDAFQKAGLIPSVAESVKSRATSLRTQLVTRALRQCLPGRDGDVFISTFPKSGTTWMQQVVCMLSGEPRDVDIQMRAPYIEAAIATCVFSMQRLRELPAPRLFKTHAAFEDLPVAGCTKAAPPPNVKVVIVVRDPRDVMVSLYYHSKSIKGISYQGTWDEWFDDFVNGVAPLPMAAASGADGGDGEGKSDSSKSDWFSHTLGWWRVARDHPEQVLWVRYEDMLADPLASVRRVAQLVNPSVVGDDSLLREIVHASSFGEMKQRHDACEENNEMRNAGGTSHFRKGQSGDWRRHLSAAQRERFGRVMVERLKGSGLEDAFEQD